MNEEQLRILIKAKDEASAQINKMRKNMKSDIDDLRGDFKRMFTDLRSGSLSIGQFFASAVAELKTFATTTAGMITIIGGVIAALGGILFAAKSGISAIVELGSSLGKLEGAAIRFGQNADDVRQSMTSLSDDGLIKVSTAAEGLSRLLSQGLNIEEATALMERYKDVAALGRKETVSMDQAVLNLSQSFATELSTLGDNSGLWENYNQILEIGASQLGKNVDELTRSERAQAKLIGTMLVSTRAQGDASRIADTYTGVLSRLSNTMFKLRVFLGAIFIPIFDAVARDTDRALNAVLGFLERVAPGITDMGLQFAKASTEGMESLGGWMDAMDQAGANTVSTAEKMADALNEFADSIKREKENFEQSLADAVRKHLDRVEAIKEQIKDEQDSYNEYIQDRTDRFNELTLEEEQRHAKKVTTIKKQIQEERDEYRKRNQEIEDELQSRLLSEEQEHKRTVDKIKQQIREQILFGAANARQRIEELQLSLRQEVEMHEERTDEIKKDLADETKDAKDRFSERVADLAGKLAEENKEHSKTVSKREAEFKKETSKRKTELDKRQSEYNSELSREQAILDKHSADVEKIRKQEIKDDITLLKEAHKQRLEDLEKAHEKQLKEIERTTGAATQTWASAGSDAGKNFVDGIVDGIGEQANRVDFKELAKNLFWESGRVAFNTAASFVEKLTELVADFDKAVPVFRMLGIEPQRQEIPRINEDFTMFQHGGIVTRPTLAQIGEKGQPEAVLPLHRLAEFMPQQGGATINVNVNGLVPFTSGQRRQVGEMILKEIVTAADAQGVSLEDLGRK